MEKIRVGLHMDKKKALILIVFFLAVSILLLLLISISTSSNVMQLNALLHSDYKYSATSQVPTNQDEYYLYNAGISFALPEKSDSGLNADVLMQTDSSQYTDALFWNTNHLDANSIAVSENLAWANNLKVGDVLLSRHIVDGTTYDYTIVQILPKISAVRVLPNGYSNGIILMGFDGRYADNISHSFLAFSKRSVNDMPTEYTKSMEKIIYREDEMTIVFNRLLPYFAVTLAVSAMITVGLVLLLKKDITYNFKRQIMLGFEMTELNKAYNRYIYGVGSIAIVSAFSIALAAVSVNGLLNIEVVLLLSVFTVEFISLFLTASISNKRLWRSR